MRLLGRVFVRSFRRTGSHCPSFAGVVFASRVPTPCLPLSPSFASTMITYLVLPGILAAGYVAYQFRNVGSRDEELPPGASRRLPRGASRVGRVAQRPMHPRQALQRSLCSGTCTSFPRSSRISSARLRTVNRMQNAQSCEQSQVHRVGKAIWRNILVEAVGRHSNHPHQHRECERANGQVCRCLQRCVRIRL